MALDADTLFEGLVQKNFLPQQKKAKDELPPVFSTDGLTPEIAEKVSGLELSTERKKLGFDTIEYQSTRFNNVPRILSIPHPKAHIDLSNCFRNHWDKIQKISTNELSLVRPREHDDGRIIIMDYDAPWQRRERTNRISFSKKFRVTTDISNCFPSLYSHSISWALVGLDEAKAAQHDKEQWFNLIDSRQRRNKRNETSGVPIGPATSNISAEIILQNIDSKLSGEFSYYRYVDDYISFAETFEKAEKFIRVLNSELSQYKMALNINKTYIEELPIEIDPSWILELRSKVPVSENISASDASQVLDVAVRLQRTEKGGSILKYAAKSLIHKVSGLDVFEFLGYLFKLAFHYPILMPILDVPLEKAYEQSLLGKPILKYEEQLRLLLRENVQNGRSDAVCWILFYLRKFHPKISEIEQSAILGSRDSLSIAMLSLFDTCLGDLVEFSESLKKYSLYELDQYWLLLSRLYGQDLIQDPYGDGCFEILKSANIEFVNYTDES